MARRRLGSSAGGALIVDQDFLTRLPSNPFFPYLLARTEEGIDRPSGATGRNLVTTPSPGLPVRLEALLAENGVAAPALRRTAIAVTALVDGLWLELSLGDAPFSPEEAERLAERWLDSVAG
mgnify:CR=1 FL=1